MVKDAWIGDVIKYPMGRNVTLPDGTQVPWRDVVREFIELRTSGGVGALPSDRDANGNLIVEYQPPTGVSGATQIMEWIHDLDWDIFDGLYIPREIVEAAASGSGYSGRSIPFVAYLTIRDMELADYARQVNEQVLRPLVALNYGGRAAQAYEIKPVPLMETIGKLMGEPDKSDANGQQQQPQQPQQQPQPFDPFGGAQFAVDAQGNEHSDKTGQFVAKGKGDQAEEHQKQIDQQRKSRITHESVKSLFADALKGKSGRAHLADVSSSQALQIAAVAKAPISEEFRHVIDAQHLWHSYRQSRDRTDEDNLPLEESDFELLPAILRTPDNIRPAHDGPNQARRVEFLKRVNGHMFIITEARRKHREMAIVTIVKRRVALKKEG